MTDIGELTGIGLSYSGDGNRVLFSDPDNEQQAQKFPLLGMDPIVEISVGFSDDNIE